MFKFQTLEIGDVFNTLSGRWAKIGVIEALCIMSSVHKVGEFQVFELDQSIIPLYSSSPEINKLISLIDKGLKVEIVNPDAILFSEKYRLKEEIISPISAYSKMPLTIKKQFIRSLATAYITLIGTISTILFILFEPEPAEQNAVFTVFLLVVFASMFFVSLFTMLPYLILSSAGKKVVIDDNGNQIDSQG